MISIAMTSYNGEKYICEQLESLVKQTVIPDEVIIVDDCSTDNTVYIIKEFIRDNRLKNWNLICQEENVGYKKSFYTAIKEAKGDIIFLCDHDDVWFDNKIHLMKKLMDDNPAILSLNSSFVKIDDEGNEINTRRNFLSSNNNLIRRRVPKDDCVVLNLQRVVSYNISPGCTMAFRSELKETMELLDDDEFDLVHDWKINVIAAAKNGLFFLNTPTIEYRLHDNNAIGLKKNTDLDGRIAEYGKLLDEREYLENILQYFCNSDKLNTGYGNALSYVRDINESIEERMVLLRMKSISNYLKLPLKYNSLRSRMIESWLLDVYLLFKHKIIKSRGEI